MSSLTPPDLAQCQAEIRQGSFMTFGPRRMERCSNKPTCIASERQPGSDGQTGSMSLCDDCAKVASKKLGKSISFRRIER